MTDFLTLDTFKAGLTAEGLVLTFASAAGGAGLRIPHGTAPTSPTNGDLWTTTAGLYARVNGVTVGPFSAGGLDQTTADARYVNLDGDTMTASLTLSGDPASALHAAPKQYVDLRSLYSGSYLDRWRFVTPLPTFETSTNGTTWVPDARPISQLFDASETVTEVCNDASPYARFTFSAQFANYVEAVVIPFGWASGATHTTKIDVSDDGVAWTPLIPATTIEPGATNYYPHLGGMWWEYTRVTFAKTAGSGSLFPSSLQAWTRRKSNAPAQGYTAQNVMPMSWNYAKAVTFPGTVTVNGALNVEGSFLATGALEASTGQFFSLNVDDTLVANTKISSQAIQIWGGTTTVGHVLTVSNADGTATWQAPTGSGGGISQATADGLYVNVTGDSMTGDLGVTGNVTVSGSVTVGWLSGDTYLVGGLLADGVGARTGTDLLLTSNLHCSATWTVKGLITPTAADHAANKGYVDTRTPKVTVASTAPGSPAVNDVWIDTT